MSQMATPGVVLAKKKIENTEKTEGKNLGNILYIWFCMVKSKYLNSEKQKQISI